MSESIGALKTYSHEFYAKHRLKSRSTTGKLLATWDKFFYDRHDRIREKG